MGLFQKWGWRHPPPAAPLKRRPTPASRLDRRSTGRDNHCVLLTDPLRSYVITFFSYFTLYSVAYLKFREIRIQSRDIDFSLQIFLDLFIIQNFEMEFVRNRSSFIFCSYSTSFLSDWAECPLTWLGNHPALLPNLYASTQARPIRLCNCLWRCVLGLAFSLIFNFSNEPVAPQAVHFYRNVCM